MSATTTAAMRSTEAVTLTKFPGRPTLRRVNITRDEISGQYAMFKTTHPDFPLGSRFGFAAAVMKQTTFIRLHNDVAAVANALPENWEFQHPDRPTAYDETIANNSGDNARRRREAQHPEKIKEHDLFENLEAIYKRKIEEAYDDVYLRNLRNDVLGFSHVTVREMLEHLQNQCLAINDLD